MVSIPCEVCHWHNRVKPRGAEDGQKDKETTDGVWRFYPRSDEDRLYVPGDKGGRGRMAVEETVRYEEQSLYNVCRGKGGCYHENNETMHERGKGCVRKGAEG